MKATVAVRHQFLEFCGVLRVVAVPDPVDETLSHLKGAMLAGDGVSEYLYALGMIVSDVLRERLLGGLRCFILRYGTAPDDVACVLSLYIREKYLADCGAGSICCKDEVCGGGSGNAVLVLVPHLDFALRSI